MWKAIITKTAKNQFGALEISVDFTNGQETYTHIYRSLNEDELKVQVTQQKEFYEKTSSLVIKPGEIDLTPTPVIPPTPTPAEEAKKKFIEDLTRLRGLEKAIAIGITGLDKDLAETKQRVQDNFLSEYLTLIF